MKPRADHRTRLADTLETRLLDALSDGVILVDPDWRLAFVNRTAAALLRLDPEEVVGRVIGGDAPEPPEARMRIYREVMRDRRMRRLEGVRLEHPELAGRVFDGEIHPSPTGGIVLLFRDVTERAAAEAEARARAEEAERRIRESEALRSLGRDILSRVELDTVLRRTVQHARELLDAGYTAVATREPSGETVWRAVVGNRSELWHRALFPPGRGTAGRVVAACAPLVIEGFPHNPDFPPDEFPVHVEEGMRSALGVPLLDAEGRAFGSLIAGGGSRSPSDRTRWSWPRRWRRRRAWRWPTRGSSRKRTAPARRPRPRTAPRASSWPT